MDQVDRLLGSRVVDELHALVWTRPIVNRGTFDPGWSCREHAASIAALLTLEGVPVHLRHGRCMFIQGAAGNNPPICYGQESSSGLKRTSTGRFELACEVVWSLAWCTEDNS